MTVGTNYFCQEGEKVYTRMHIGKKIAGWVFAFRDVVIPVCTQLKYDDSHVCEIEGVDCRNCGCILEPIFAGACEMEDVRLGSYSKWREYLIRDYMIIFDDSGRLVNKEKFMSKVFGC